jgi:hypothetical protein
VEQLSVGERCAGMGLIGSLNQRPIQDFIAGVLLGHPDRLGHRRCGEEDSSNDFSRACDYGGTRAV